MYKYLFGPVPSRRLGMSLGVDLVPHKVCSLNCVYCECGKTTSLTIKRDEYINVEEVIKELTDFFENKPNPDYITFSGAGEPTLNSGIGRIIEFIKAEKPNIPVAVLTNGTLLSNKELRLELLNADVVLPSLDAATKSAFIKIDRPNSKINIDDYINGIIDFSNEFNGKIWLEVFILPNYNNDTENLDALKEVFLKIKPEVIQINTLDRPGTVEDITAANKTELERIKDYWNLPNVEIIAAAPQRKNIISYREDIENMILETIARRPCTVADIAKIAGTHINEINKYLGVLEDENKIKISKRERGIFYMIK